MILSSHSAPDTIYVSSLIYSHQFYLHPPIITTWKALGSIISQINCQCGEGVIGRVCVKLSAKYKVRFGSPQSRGKQQKTEFGALLALLNQGHLLFTCSPLIKGLSANPIFTAYMFFTTAPNTLLIGKIDFLHGGFFITPTMH